MRRLLHTVLVGLTLLSQFVGGVAVLCVESDGGLLVEFQLDGCCESMDSLPAPASVTRAGDECGSCQDLSLAQPTRLERDTDHLGRALDLATTLTLVGFPCAPALTLTVVPRSPHTIIRAHGSPAVRAQVAETVVLTC